MRNTNIILHDKEYMNLLLELEGLEVDRKFCKHNLEHFIGVGRIAYILNLEGGYGFSKDLIYTAALLHDIGRVLQYKNGIEHNEGSVQIAKKFLLKTDYSDDDKKMILEAILHHRKVDEKNVFNEIFYKADKLSRNCFLCASIDQCHWDENIKNLDLKYWGGNYDNKRKKFWF